MASNMTTIALVLLSALTVNAANLRSNSSGSFPACPQGGWTYNTITGHCYRKWPAMSVAGANITVGGPVLKALQYDHAAKACKHFGARIAVPNNAAELTFLRNLFSPKAEFFIGFDQSGLSSGLWEDYSTEAQNNWHTLAVSGASAKKLPVGAKVALGVKTNGSPLPSTGFIVKPVLTISASGAWAFKSKTDNFPFICELVFCVDGCNTKEKAAGIYDSVDTIVYTR